jgi:hypothetical protein
MNCPLKYVIEEKIEGMWRHLAAKVGTSKSRRK